MVFYVQPELSKYTGRVVYKLIFPDRKVYIGYASTSHKRIDAHKKEAYAKRDGNWKCNNRCKEAIREFGWKNMQVEIMEFVPKWISLKEREKYWIEQYMSDDPKYGYNSNKGGGGLPAGVYKHTAEAKAAISAASTDRGIKHVTRCKILEDGDTQKVRLTFYTSATAAERDIGVSRADICSCCVGKNMSAGGSLWWFTKEDDIFDKDIIVSRLGNIPQLRARSAIISILPLTNGKALEQWHANMHDAMRTLSTATGKTFDDGNISKCCSGRAKFHRGYHFRRVTTETEEDFTEEKREVEYKPQQYNITKKRKR